ncbi:MAG TPA: D-alanyl-D-alanine carboxypeptidase/D-alanyl-D-alanine-endopeptidase [Flavisolibacter sp.]|nr:D-alanyl-D-alanine carboxypeptidase/D-alanyl-D-alanine-endopeptidase [Flavisolibacter sp.]
MKNLFITACFLALQPLATWGQTATARLQAAYQAFEKDPQLDHALSSLYVIDAKTGKVVFDRNSSVGLAPASTQKIITAATAYELLGRQYRYGTSFIHARNNGEDVLFIKGSGDPTLGSQRYASTQPSMVLEKLRASLVKKGLSLQKLRLALAAGGTSDAYTIPSGYIWEDIGNYYGSGHGLLNWRENQYDIVFSSGAPGSAAKILSTKPGLPGVRVRSMVTAGREGSGDNAYIYFVPGSTDIVVRGTIPPNSAAFSISGALPDPGLLLSTELGTALSGQATIMSNAMDLPMNTTAGTGTVPPNGDTVHTHYSPQLDSIVYWFLRKSINLYGEALIKTLPQKNGMGDMQTGLAALKAFWKERSVEPTELNMADGSGLSPLNRVTTHAQVAILRYARQQSWFPGYYSAFPEYNGMKMKSGTISGAKGFCGYHKAGDGSEYVFSFIVNNYNGSASALVQKMYAVLNELK